MAIFGPKPWVYPFWKNVNFSTFSTSCFYSVERRLFCLEYRKRHFAGLYCPKIKVGKMAIFGPTPWVNSCGKVSIFRLFELRFFYILERLLFALKYRKRHFPGLYCPKIKLGKMAIFGPKPWVNPFAKMSIFRLYGLLIFIA